MNQFGLLLFGGITSMLIVSKSKSAKTNEAAAINCLIQIA